MTFEKGEGGTKKLLHNCSQLILLTLFLLQKKRKKRRKICSICLIFKILVFFVDVGVYGYAYLRVRCSSMDTIED